MASHFLYLMEEDKACYSKLPQAPRFLAMKTNRFDKARVLTTAELDLLHDQLPSTKHRVLASVLRRTGARVSEGLQLRWQYVSPSKIIYTAPTTKGGTKTRSIPTHPLLAKELEAWKAISNPDNDPKAFVFPGRNPGEPMTRRSFDHALRKVIKDLNLPGTSTHSFRRSFLTAASENGVPLRAIQSISGHSSLTMLSNYLEVSESAKTNAVMNGA